MRYDTRLDGETWDEMAMGQAQLKRDETTGEDDIPYEMRCEGWEIG